MLNRQHLFAIRLCDIIFSFFGLVILSPVLIFIYIAGALILGSPLYRQQRMGMDQHPFTLVKFRTMSKGTAAKPTHLISSHSMTPYGRFLRKTKLDELPQLWNVLKGEMSLVGPRPSLFTQIELISARQAAGLFEMRPGITGLAQINAIDMSNPALLAQTDKKMVSNFSILSYFKYILVTILGKGYGDRVIKIDGV